MTSLRRCCFRACSACQAPTCGCSCTVCCRAQIDGTRLTMCASFSVDDVCDNILLGVRGRKRVVMFEPTEVRCVRKQAHRPNRAQVGRLDASGSTSRIVDVDAEARINHRFAKVPMCALRCAECVVGARRTHAGSSASWALAMCCTFLHCGGTRRTRSSRRWASTCFGVIELVSECQTRAIADRVYCARQSIQTTTSRRICSATKTWHLPRRCCDSWTLTCRQTRSALCRRC
jgi:hypothetical protein